MGACISAREAQIPRSAHITLLVHLCSCPRGLTVSLAKLHAQKVRDELVELLPSVRTNGGLIYLPGQSTKEYEDSDGEAPFRQRR